MLTIVVGGFYGSEGKGSICNWLHHKHRYEWATRVGGPNAGHTVWKDGERYALQQLPVAAVADPQCTLVIAAGSEVDFDILEREIARVEKGTGHGVRNRLLIDQEATVLTAEHGEAEAAIGTGTTGKGIGAARAERAMRRAQLVRQASVADQYHVADTQQALRDALSSERHVLIEGTQGYKLGSHAGAYPWSTSGDCKAIDAMAACGLTPTTAGVWVVLRSHPIRIAGNSGPLSNETTWDQIGVPPEITTVTKKVRRVAEWDLKLAQESIAANGGPNVSVALTFADYWHPELKGVNANMALEELPTGLQTRIHQLQDATGATVRVLGTGPDSYIEIEIIER